MDDLCRFCLSSESTQIDDKLISPCDCRGSIQYVHISCMKKWRQYTSYNEHKQICQLCHTYYIFPRKWVYEHMPYLTSLWNVLGNSLLIVLLACYFCILIIPRVSRDIIIENKSVIPNYYMYVMGTMSGIYMAAFLQLFYSIQNKRLYATYFLDNNKPYLILLLASGFLTYLQSMPFGILFLYYCSRFIHQHMNIIIMMNFDGEII
jgi:hypothetical protein